MGGRAHGARAVLLRSGPAHPEEAVARIPDMSTEAIVFEGGCTCRALRYRLLDRPLFVHCCHCRWCQRETGASFALNALIEADRVELLQGEVVVVDTPSNSGQGQRIARCPRCHVAVWSNYGGAGDAVRF